MSIEQVQPVEENKNNNTENVQVSSVEALKQAQIKQRPEAEQVEVAIQPSEKVTEQGEKAVPEKNTEKVTQETDKNSAGNETTDIKPEDLLEDNIPEDALNDDSVFVEKQDISSSEEDEQEELVEGDSEEDEADEAVYEEDILEEFKADSDLSPFDPIDTANIIEGKRRKTTRTSDVATSSTAAETQ